MTKNGQVHRKPDSDRSRKGQIIYVSLFVILREIQHLVYSCHDVKIFDSYNLVTNVRSCVMRRIMMDIKIRGKRTGFIFQIMSSLSPVCGYFINIKHRN